MPHCTLPLCTNGSRKTKEMDISYHRLPNGPLRSVWLRNLHQENPRERANTYVCSAHFTPDCFDSWFQKAQNPQQCQPYLLSQPRPKKTKQGQV